MEFSANWNDRVVAQLHYKQIAQYCLIVLGLTNNINNESSHYLGRDASCSAGGEE